ncbi:uncharacterized protein LOC126380570 [Pectinophora gossypiella]|uniref:uncharacterized protein LOC126380570 n=1 Tax=Pectinophora gossypiella TaxID=13191 RepID=UPI00214F3877|nr:uncharacterized protein LOC126380570 [Pectinophora gossypiella]
MEQIFLFEIFVKRIVLKIEPPTKDEYELRMEEEERKREAEALAALEALKKGKKGKAKKPPKPKKGKKGKKEPPGPSEEEMKYMQTCTVQMNCLPLFDLYVAHDNFVAPPPPPPPPKAGKKGKKAKPKKKKKGKKGKPVVFKLALPSEPLPQPPYFGVGSSIMILSRPGMLEEILRKTPIYIQVWNREEHMNCIGFCIVEWHETFLECVKRSGDYNPVDMDQAEYRNPEKPEMFSNTVQFIQPLQCEEDLKASGEVEFYVRLSCLGNKVISYFIQLPEMERLPGRKYLNDELKLRDLEVVRHWEGTYIENVPPVAYFFGAPDIMREPVVPVEKEVVYEDFVAPFTNSELAILAMGFPKGPCGGTNCPKRMDFRGSQHQFIHGDTVKGKYQHGQFVNKRDLHGPCGRLDCPLAKKIRTYICNEGCYKPCKKPCPKDYY